MGTLTGERSFIELARSPRSELEAVFRAGVMPEATSLEGFEWRGFNVPWRAKLTGQKFIKGFFSSPLGLEGYNVRVARNGLVEPWIERPSPENPKRWAFFMVAPVDAGSRDALYPEALLVNYGASPRNPPRAVERALRGYLKQPDPADPDHLIGKAYWAVGSRRWYAAFYVLERYRPASWRPDA